MTIQIHATAGDVAYFATGPERASTHANRRQVNDARARLEASAFRHTNLAGHFVTLDDVDKLTEAMDQAKDARP